MKTVPKILPPGVYIVVPIVLDVLFQHPLCNPTEAADIVFSNFNACAVLIYCFRFLAWIQVNDFLLRNVVIKNGLLTLAHALLTFCSRFAHGVLTL